MPLLPVRYVLKTGLICPRMTSHERNATIRQGLGAAMDDRVTERLIIVEVKL